MATSMEELTTCIICFETFRDPLVLPCDHTFCKKCVNEMKRGLQIKCPTCNTVSDMQDVKTDFKLGKFLDAFAKQAEEFTKLMEPEETTKAMVTTGNTKCEVCRNKAIGHWCTDCEQWMCDSCKTSHHNLKLAKGHVFQSMTVITARVKSGLKHELQELVEKVKKFENAVQFCLNTIEQEDSVEAAALKQCTDLRSICHKEIDQSFDKLQEQIKDYNVKTMANCKHSMDNMKEQLTKLRNEQEKLTRLITSNADTLATEGDKLLKQAQQCLQSLSEPRVEIQLPVLRLERNKSWKASEAVKLQLAQDQVTYKDRPDSVLDTSGEEQKMMLAEVVGKQWYLKQQEQIPLANYIFAVRVINQQLWCCCSGSIAIYDSDLQQQRTIPRGDMRGVRDVAEMSNGDIVIAARKGLYHFDAIGNYS